jgi:pantoate--beta-alanine ligase
MQNSINQVEYIPELRKVLSSMPRPLGFVPTMGYLHEGHLSLVRQAREECATVVVSIFVNPSQFGPQEDLGAYPRDLPRDLSLLAALGADLVWSPSEEEMYPEGYQTWIEVNETAIPLEGRMRPGHFRGVATIVAKLFNCVQPDAAYFGQKDYQQAAVIRRMVKDLNFPVNIIVSPIVREADGLALSSRNVYLSPEERKAAVVLSRALFAAQDAFDKGEKEADKLRDIMSRILADEPLAQPQYVSCAKPDTLQELEIVSEEALLSMAVFIGKTRLIDNILLRVKNS